jgi:chromosome segregation ATPase
MRGHADGTKLRRISSDLLHRDDPTMSAYLVQLIADLHVSRQLFAQLSDAEVDRPSELKDEIADIKADLKSVTKELKECDDEREELRKELEGLTKDHKEMISDLSGIRPVSEARRVRIEELEAERSALIGGLADFDSAIESHSPEQAETIRGLNRRIKGLESANDELRDTNQRGESDLERLGKQLTAMTGFRDDFAGFIKKKDAQLAKQASFPQERQQLTDQIASLKGQLQGQDNLLEQLNDLQIRIAEQDGIIAEFAAAPREPAVVPHVSHVDEAVSAERDALRRENAALKKENAALKQDYTVEFIRKSSGDSPGKRRMIATSVPVIEEVNTPSADNEAPPFDTEALPAPPAGMLAFATSRALTIQSPTEL